MSSGPFGLPLATDPERDRNLRAGASYWDNQQRVMYMGHKDQGTGTDVLLRFMASRGTEYVQVHVQSDASGQGGFSYDADNFISTTQVDCRVKRLQEVTISRNGSDQYWVFLIPKAVYAA